MSAEAGTLLAAIRQHPERPLLIYEDERFTPSSLCTAAGTLRAQYPELATAGVALQFANTIEMLVNLIALDGHARAILLLPPCLSPAAVAELAQATGTSYLLNNKGLSAIVPQPVALPGRDASRWLFTTSGTTGPPKVYSHTLRSLSVKITRQRKQSRAIRWGLAYQPHRFAGVQVVLQALVSGNSLVVPPASDSKAMVASFVRHQVNTLSATPSQWRNFLAQGDINQCPLQQITLGGEIADQAILSALRRQFPDARIVHIYASTEAGAGFSVSDGKAGFPQAWLDQGPPLELKISAAGSLLIRSQAISDSDSLGPRLTPDGYLDTQDEVGIRNGRVHFLGRVTGIINVGGNKVHPEEVENLVREVEGVQNALVSARSSPIMGQLVLLEVQAGELSAEETLDLKRRIRDHCRKQLPKYKVPALINIVAELTVSESGKVRRRQTA